jgi:two-component system, sensor histidine kinase ChiS
MSVISSFKVMDGRRASRGLAAFLLICVTLLALAANVRAGVQAGPADFQYVGVEQGLSHARVACVVQDKIGFLWIGTAEGLNRYDGQEFRTYRHVDKDNNSLANDAIWDLCVDAEGFLWVATGAGLDRIDPKTNELKHYVHADNDPKSLGDNRLRTLALDRVGRTLWIGTMKGLDRLDLASEEFVHYPYGAATSSTLGTKPVTEIFEDGRGVLWLGMADGGGLTSFEPRTGRFVHYRHDPKVADSLASDAVRAIYEDRSGSLWVGTFDAGLDRLDRRTGAFTHFGKRNGEPGGLPADGVLTITEARGTLLIGTSDKGLYAFDAETKRFAPYRNTPFLLAQQPTRYITAIFEDRQKILWVGSANGLYADGRRQKYFYPYRSVVSAPDGLGDNMVWGMCEDRAGSFWIATNNGVARLEPKTQTFTRYVHSPDDPFSLSDDHARGVYEDRNGRIWVATMRGLNVFDPSVGRFTRYFHDPDNPASLSDNYIRSVYQTKDGTFWVCTRNGGLNRFDPETGRAVRYRHDPNDPTTISNDKVYCVYEDRFGALWVCTRRGLNRLDQATGQFTRYLHVAGDETSLSYDDVYSVVEDAAGTFWVCTREGLNQFDRDSERRTALFKTSEGLPNNVTYFALPDKAGNLWIGTENGLCRFDPREGSNSKEKRRTRTFDLRDGLQANEFNEGAYHRSATGNFLVGGVNGFNVFRPEEIQGNTAPPPVMITGFRLLDDPVKNFNPSAERTLSYDQNSCAFEFAALNFIRSEENEYSYMLEGVDPDWVSSGNRRYARYTNLPPGEYVFVVKAANNDGVWNAEVARIKFRILAPWWRMWWAYFAYGVVGATLISGAFGMQAWRIRLRAQMREARLREAVAKADQRAAQIEADAAKLQMQTLERENRQRAESEARIRLQNEELQEANLKLKELDQIKAGFTAMLVHDLKSPLAAVKATLSLLEMTEDGVQDPDLLNLVEGSQRNVEQVMNLINEMLDVFRSEMNDIQLDRNPAQPERLLGGCVQSAALVAGAKNLRLTADLEPNLPLVDVDFGKMERVFTNLLSNAVKFTPEGGEITVCARSVVGTGVESGMKMLMVSVTDTGDGVAAEDLPYIFEPYHQAKSFKSGLGVGLGLAIVRRIVAAHGGNVSVRSQIGVGSCFSVTLPAWSDADGDDVLALYSAAMPETAEAQIEALNRLK